MIILSQVNGMRGQSGAFVHCLVVVELDEETEVVKVIVDAKV